LNVSGALDHSKGTSKLAKRLKSPCLGDADSVNLQCIAALYGIPPADGACAGNSLGIYSEGTYTQQSLDNFFANVSTKIPLGTRPNVANIDGGSVASTSASVSFETELDLQIAYPIIYPQNITLFEVDSHANGTGFMNTFLDSIDAVSNSTLVLLRTIR
jgi:tripeptidyl-peptidase-1